jgi:recombinational DNA repair protein (RecF pathway)
LSFEEKQKILEALHESRFTDQSPAEVYASLLDEGVYLGSISTMYRILRSQQEARERRNQLFPVILSLLTRVCCHARCYPFSFLLFLFHLANIPPNIIHTARITHF